MIKYSFIVPVKEINDYIRETIQKILEIKRDDFEIIVYPDKATREIWDKTRQISTGRVGPAQKRNLAIRDSLGEILVFIDDDAYPEKNFLDILDENFNDPNVTAVGGPAITPQTDSFFQKVSGAVFLSRLSHSHPERYWSLGRKRFVDDWPSVNLSIRKKSFTEINGFDSEYWPGEDTKLCLDIIKKLNGKILYEPELIVYHHRRSGLINHLKQVGGYGLHRGFFAKKFPETSFKLKYFIPSGFFIFVVFGWVLLFFPLFFQFLYFSVWILYLFALIFALFDIYAKIKDAKISLVSIFYIFLTHIYYGFRFIQGFVFTKNLKSKLK